MLVRELLPTPTASDANGRQTSDKSKELYGSGPTMTDVVKELLATATAKDAPRASDNDKGFVALAEAVTDLLPTLNDLVGELDSPGHASDPRSPATSDRSDVLLPGL